MESLQFSEKQLPIHKRFHIKKKIEFWNWKWVEEEEEQKTNRRKMLYKGHKNIYDFTKVRTICTFGNAVLEWHNCNVHDKMMNKTN